MLRPVNYEPEQEQPTPRMIFLWQTYDTGSTSVVSHTFRTHIHLIDTNDSMENFAETFLRASHSYSQLRALIQARQSHRLNEKLVKVHRVILSFKKHTGARI